MNTPSLESTPLTAAIFEEREDVIAYLLKKGADVNILVSHSVTAAKAYFSLLLENLFVLRR